MSIAGLATLALVGYASAVKTKRHRANTRPSIVGAWKPQRPVAMADNADDLSEDDRKLFGEQDRRLATSREEQIRVLEAQDPAGYRRLGELLSPEPRSKRKGGQAPPIDVLRNDLQVEGEDAVDVSALLDAVVAVVGLAFDATIGIGDGGLFNFEHAAIEQLVATTKGIADDRKRAREMIRQQDMLEELTEIYDATSKAWGKDARRDPNHRDRFLLTKPQERLLETQSQSLTALFERHGVAAERLRFAVRDGRSIREAQGPLNAAGATLQAIGFDSGSAITKDQRRISALFEYRAAHETFPLAAGDDVTARRFAKFAYALFLAAASNPPVHIRSGPSAEVRRRTANALHKRFILASRFNEAAARTP